MEEAPPTTHSLELKPGTQGSKSHFSAVVHSWMWKSGQSAHHSHSIESCRLSIVTVLSLFSVSCTVLSSRIFASLFEGIKLRTILKLAKTSIQSLPWHNNVHQQLWKHPLLFACPQGVSVTVWIAIIMMVNDYTKLIITRHCAKPFVEIDSFNALWPSCMGHLQCERDLGLIPGLGRSPGEGKGYPLQYSGLENSMDCIVHGGAKSQTQLRDFHFHLWEWFPFYGWGNWGTKQESNFPKVTQVVVSSEAQISLQAVRPETGSSDQCALLSATACWLRRQSLHVFQWTHDLPWRWTIFHMPFSLTHSSLYQTVHKQFTSSPNCS